MVALERARGKFGLAVKRDQDNTRLAELVQGGCCRLLFPRVPHAGLEAVLVNISGGIAAGDRIRGDLTCAEGTDLLVTSQAAERIYRARADDPPATMDVACHIAAGARLEWLPHETIFFDQSHLVRHMSVTMEETSSFLYLESRVFGRSGSNEVLTRLGLRDRLSVSRAGHLVFEDMLRLESTDVSTLLAHPAVAGGHGAVTTMVLVAREAQALLQPVRDLLAERGIAGFAASAWHGMLVVRGIAADTWSLKMAIHGLLPVLRGTRPMPATWRL